MMETLRSAAILLAVSVSACDDATSEKVASIQISDEGTLARLKALPEEQRDAVFLRAVRDAGHDCQFVAGSAYNGIHFSMPSWAARCSDGRDWLIMLDRSGRAHVARRQEAPSENKK